MELPGMFTDKGIDRSIWQSPNFSIDPGVEFARDDIPVNAGTGALRAWDPVAQKLRWEVKLPGVWNPGTLTTGGNLVIQGRTDGKLVAYRATDGESLWQFDTGLGISAPPITYTVNGKQHIALLVGWGGAGPAVGGSLQAQHGWAYRAQPRRLISFSLEGTADLPKLPPPSFAKPLKQEDFKVDEMLAQQGNVLWAKHCVLCHGAGAVSGGYAPDLRASTIPLYDAALQDVVVKGSRQTAGMPRFHEFSAGDLKALQHYIRREARR
jgi:quinohemoprotein ethanol dehydrogenase